MARKKTTEETPTLTATAPELPPPPAVPKEKPLNNLQRVKLMNDLVVAVDDPQVIESFLRLNNGQKILEIFTNSVDSEVARLMGGDAKTAEQAGAQELTTTLQQAAQALGAFRKAIQALSESPIMSILTRLHGSAGGRQPVQQPMPLNGNGDDVMHDPEALGVPGRRDTGAKPNYLIP